jgi:hypothetical protein
VNSEELELSLRTEFENYLKEVFGEMRQEITALQERVEADLEKQKSQLNEVFTEVLSRFESGKELDAGFKESVIEHLRLAKDEGAKITATAIAQAEELEREAAAEAQAASTAGMKEIYEGVNDISQKTSQSDILKTLVHHAASFASRGAFFIIKNEHLVGWRTFGKDSGGVVEEKVREVFLPVSADSILSASVKSLSTTEDNSYSASDAELFAKLEFDAPEKMVAIPLVARGRGVAVLYADSGTENSAVNVEGLETLIRVAGLTVEVLASAKAPAGKKVSSQKVPEVEFEEETPAVKAEETTPVKEEESSPAVESLEPISHQTTVSESIAEPVFTPQPSVETSYVSEPEVETSFVARSEFETSYQSSFENDSYTISNYEEVVNEDFTSGEAEVESEVTAPAEKYPEFETAGQGFSAQEFAANFAKETDPPEYAKDISGDSVETTSGFEFETSSDAETVETPAAEEFVPTNEQTYGSFEVENGQAEMVETVSEPVSAPPAKSRLSERNVDLPIEVTEDERRLHNDARRFARLLVSEIKLYNEQKVKEGRDASDLYDRLKEAIDRSREMYDKRVQPPVAAKFDYFHYELVNTLAEGDDNKLGTGYPGSAV